MIFKYWGTSINILASMGSRAMSLTPLFHSSPLILLTRRVPESQKFSCPREGPFSWVRAGQGTLREAELGLSSEEGSDSLKKEERAIPGGGGVWARAWGGNMEGDKKRWNQGEEKDT